MLLVLFIFIRCVLFNNIESDFFTLVVLVDCIVFHCHVLYSIVLSCTVLYDTRILMLAVMI